MKLLYLEDNEDEAQWVLGMLRGEWPDCQVDMTNSRAGFCTQLLGGGYDLILSDFNLGQFTGLEALKLARQQCPSVPFLFFSGTIGEDRAVEAMQMGAMDYVIKDRPKRLIPALRRALETARQLQKQNEVEEQLQRVQRLESLGMLAAGIAHDFNNVLAPVLMSVPLLSAKLKEPMDLRILANMDRSARRGASLVRQILGFSQGVTGEPHIIEVRHLAGEIMDMMRQTFPRSIQIVDHVDKGLWQIRMNSTQLHQILLNLCVNARDAMPDGGTLTVSAKNCSLDEIGSIAIYGAKPGDYLLLEITDTGTGIPPDILDNVWEPFFTTKEKGSGTGLGLATVRSIVENNQGYIHLISQLGQGTKFRIYFPAAKIGAEDTREGVMQEDVPRGNDELVLLVDDDESLRDSASATLTRHGYRILTASNGTEAVALFAPRSLEIRAVITDLDMRQIDGIALAHIIERLNPGIPLLIMSGLADAENRVRLAGLEVPVLFKPFTGSVLLEAIHQMLRKSNAVCTA